MGHECWQATEKPERQRGRIGQKVGGQQKKSTTKEKEMNASVLYLLFYFLSGVYIKNSSIPILSLLRITLIE